MITKKVKQTMYYNIGVKKININLEESGKGTYSINLQKLGLKEL